MFQYLSHKTTYEVATHIRLLPIIFSLVLHIILSFYMKKFRLINFNLLICDGFRLTEARECNSAEFQIA